MAGGKASGMTVEAAPRRIRPEELEAYAEDPAVLALRGAGRQVRPRERDDAPCPCRGLSPEHRLFAAHGLDHHAGRG